MNKICGIEFHELEAEKFWSFPASYKKDSKTETRNMILSGDYIGSRKMDGAYYRFIKDMEGNMALQGRSRSVNGNFLDKIDHVPHLMDFFNELPNGTCLLGEVYFPNKEGSSNVTTIMGCLTDKAIARQEKGDKLHYYIFDIWAWDGESYMDKKSEDRFDELNACARAYPNEYIEWAEYFEGKQLWEQLSTILSSGGEGIVMTKKGTHPEPGKRPARKTLKVKKEISNTIDCFFTGHFTAPTHEYSGKEIETWKYWEKVRTGEKMEGEFYKEYLEGMGIIPVTKPHFFGWAGSLEIGLVKGDKVVPIGLLSGLTDEIKANAAEQKGKVIEVSCMEVLETGGLRHAKMVNWRPDKHWKECTWSQIGEE